MRLFNSIIRMSARSMGLLSVFALLCLFVAPSARAETDATVLPLPAPEGSGQFGRHVAVVGNGNLVITDPEWGQGRGAAYLYDGLSRQILSTIVGTSDRDRVGSGGITVLSNGNFVVTSLHWKATTGTQGAVTWGSATDGFYGGGGEVSAANSLIQAFPDEDIPVVALRNGNYVVMSNLWARADLQAIGAATWGNGSSGTVGVTGPEISLIGVGAGNNWEQASVIPLQNGNYLIANPIWDNGSIRRAGAVTWANGSGGTVGVVSVANSLAGSTAGDTIGHTPDSFSRRSHTIEGLANGNYLVNSKYWDNGGTVDAGAVTWGSGASGVKGHISASNSVVGVPQGGMEPYGHAMPNGNYYILSEMRIEDNPHKAFTWANGAVGLRGTTSTANSLTGVGLASRGVYPLLGGDLVIASPDFEQTEIVQGEPIPRQAGAITRVSGSQPTTGIISRQNSLVGTHESDRIGAGGITVLANGNVVVNSYVWSGDAFPPIGAVTWHAADDPLIGTFDAEASLLGAKEYDSIGRGGVYALANGNYVVLSPRYTYSTDATGAMTAPDALLYEAVTWGDGTNGTTGIVGPENSLIGTAQDALGVSAEGLVALDSGAFVLVYQNWSQGSDYQVGAVTWLRGDAPTVGFYDASMSLLGGFSGARLGDVVPLHNGNYVVQLVPSNEEAVARPATVTWGNGGTGVKGIADAANSMTLWMPSGGPGVNEIVPLSSGSYLVLSEYKEAGAEEPTMQATFGRGGAPTVGNPVAALTVRGGFHDGLAPHVNAYNPVHGYAVVSYPRVNQVYLFVEDQRRLDVTISGSGYGTVTNPGGGIGCTRTCSATFVEGVAVTLMAMPAQFSRFTGWGGACSGSAGSTCTVTMNAAQSVSATFVHDPNAQNPLMLLPAVRR